MRKLAVIAVFCLLCLSLAAGQQADKTKPQKTSAKAQGAAAGSVEEQIKKLEQDWAQAAIKDGAAGVEKYEADDILSVDPSGRVTDKAQDKKDFTSGDLKFQSMEVSDLKVRAYGNAAVATGVNTLKGTYKGQDISAKYRFTDTWVKRNGKWQVVASQGTKIQQQ
jgi:ketosteroid isomerase-like protein